MAAGQLATGAVLALEIMQQKRSLGKCRFWARIRLLRCLPGSRRRDDEAVTARFRTGELILEAYDNLAPAR
ncbi:MAG: hypothetical protein ACYTFA_12275 [Planctomycetota bacterium]|jgi:hypothetical protein